MKKASKRRLHETSKGVFFPLEVLLFKAIYPDIIIFILTQYDTPGYRKAAFLLGGDRFITKVSLNRMQLEEVVRNRETGFE